MVSKCVMVRKRVHPEVATFEIARGYLSDPKPSLPWAHPNGFAVTVRLNENEEMRL